MTETVGDNPKARAHVLVSRCLLGEPVRYDGEANPVEGSVLERWRREGRVVPVCPEVVGGLQIPRPPAEIESGEGVDGADVLAGEARVLTESGEDVTEAFVAGARRALFEALESEARVAVLKEGSPSCGSGRIYDGNFDGEVRDGGRGVTAALLEAYDVAVYSEDEVEQADEHLRRLDP